MLRILVIDDSMTALQVIGMILSEAGYEVCTSSDGRSALELLDREPFDVLVTDIYMPDMDGLEIILEERRLRPDIPIVAVSGMTGPRNMLPVARRLGACQTLLKPFSKASLLDAVEAALGSRRPGPGDSSGGHPLAGGQREKPGAPAFAPRENVTVSPKPHGGQEHPK